MGLHEKTLPVSPYLKNGGKLPCVGSPHASGKGHKIGFHRELSIKDMVNKGDDHPPIGFFNLWRVAAVKPEEEHTKVPCLGIVLF